MLQAKLRLREAKLGSKSGGTPPRDTASRKRVDEALKYLDQNLHGLRRGTPKRENLIRRVMSSRRPLATAKSICRDYLKASQRGPNCDASHVQELWVFKRQGRIITRSRSGSFASSTAVPFRAL